MFIIEPSERGFVVGICRYGLRVGNAISQLINTLVGGDNPNESISGRAWRERRRFGWKQTRIVIDLLFSLFHKNHCETSARNDVRRARSLIADSVEH